MVKQLVRRIFPSKRRRLSKKYLVEKRGDIGFFRTPLGSYYLPMGAPGDSVIRTMVKGEIFEPEIVDTAKRFIKEGSVVLDVGSNFGQMAILFSKLVGEQGKVYAFEANRIVFDFLKRNFKNLQA